MMEPDIHYRDGRSTPITRADAAALRRLIAADPSTFVSAPGDPPDGIPICKAIAAHLLQERSQ